MFPALPSLAVMDRLLAAACDHGEELMQSARRTDTGDSWASPDIPAHQDLTGLSHGASGPALALGELAKATGITAFRVGAERALRYERSCFDPGAGNWPDFRKSRPDGFESATFATLWCHGATGIGLTRLRLAEALGDAASSDEGHRAMKTVEGAVERALTVPDTKWCLCHGIAGNADALLTAGRSIGSAVYVEIARRVGRAGAERIGRWIESGATEIPLGLMTGLAGAGLFYLRLHDESVPSVLMPRREDWISPVCV